MKWRKRVSVWINFYFIFWYKNTILLAFFGKNFQIPFMWFWFSNWLKLRCAYSGDRNRRQRWGNFAVNCRVTFDILWKFLTPYLSLLDFELLSLGKCFGRTNQVSGKIKTMEMWDWAWLRLRSSASNPKGVGSNPTQGRYYEMDF